MRALLSVLNKIILFKVYKYYIMDSILIVKKEGFKSLIIKRGWKFFIIIAAYYGVRDTILYILIPFLIAKGLL
jgi:hypothetical protein